MPERRALKHSKEAMKLVKALRGEYAIGDSGGLAILEELAANYDTIQEASQVVRRDGLTVPGDRGGVKAHPLLAVIRDARASLLQCLKMLNLDVVPLKDVGRPPGT